MTNSNMVPITSKVSAPRHRFVEWMQGIRPLDGMDAGFYFEQSVKTGLITQEQAFKLHQRHLSLTRQEQTEAQGAFVCKTCHNEPPAGFTCRACGAGDD
ncbi:MAG: hypothetical protein HOY79_17850 [Streptomyces sp.]|nr:hypothetical protein [Streptomyces sp.]